MRTYGEIKRIAEGHWRITEIEPHVALRLKQIFPRIPKTAHKPFNLTGPEMLDADLQWFMARYPLRISNEDRAILETRTTLFEKGQSELAHLLSDNWRPAGRVAFREGESPYVYQSQAAELCRRMGGLLLMDDLGLGKAQPLTAAILTPTGWTSMGKMRVGSAVTGRDGRTYRVTGVHPQGMKRAWRVTFSDGAATECCDEHLWMVRDQNRRLRGKGWAVKPLKDLMRQGWLNKAGRPKWEIPLIEVPEFTGGNDFVVPPYVLGVLIGDGYLTGPTVTFSVPPNKQEVLDRVGALVGLERLTGPHGSTASPQWNIVGERHGCNEYRRHIVDMGLNVPSTQRFIPHSYFWGSSAARLELLRGLMDTDGSAQHGRVIYHTCSPQLAVDVAYLVRSLGGVARVREYDRAAEGKPREWQVSIRIDECPFSVTYKAAGCPSKNEHSRPRRYIRSIEFVGDKPQQCISVDAPDKLYVTDGFIVTHNTVSALATVCDQQFLPALIVPPTHLVGQWEEKAHAFTELKVHKIKTVKPYELPPADVYISPYSKLGGWVDYAERSPFRSIVFDEIQELRNGRSTSKGSAAWAFRQMASLSLGLSATPIYNYGAEIFAVIEFIREGVFGSFVDFCTEWCVMGPGGKWVVNDPQALGTFLRENHIALRRTEEDIGRENPKPNVIPRLVPFDEQVIDDESEALRHLAFTVMKGEFTERGRAAREFDLRMRRATGVAKAPHVANFVKILLEAGQPVLLMGWHREVYDIWLKMLAAYNPMLYTGTESPAKKARTKNAFINGDTNLMIMSLRSGAGLDGIQKRCRTIIFGELDWSPMVHKQCIGRLRRPGQSEQVDVIYLNCDGGSDPAILGVLGLKSSQSAGIVDPLSVPANQVSDATRIRQLAELYLAGNIHMARPPAAVRTEIVPEPDRSLLDIMEATA